MARQAIRHEGDKGEERFAQHVPSRKATKAKKGDRVVAVDGRDFHVEVKECHAAYGKSGTINQVRPIKYITCVISAPARQRWYVIPPNDLVRIAAKKSRGQHNEIPFECCNLTLNSLERYACTDDELEARVLSAIRSGEADERLKTLMRNLLRAIQDINAQYKRDVLRQ
ncbi:hypothetical protein ACFL59_10600 [Planctomycetota bacterium]